MHLLIPFAAPPPNAPPEVLAALQLPYLSQLLRQLSRTRTDCAEAASLTPPHEHALAQALDLPCADGRVPWAAQHALQQGLTPSHPVGTPPAWAWFSLCHWKTHTSGITMAPTWDLKVTEAESLALLDTVRPYAQEDGISLLAQDGARWLASGPWLTESACASMDRVIGRSIDPWMPRGPHAMDLMRLQNEIQMLFYTHPINDARAKVGLKPINSVWIHGAGQLAQASTRARPEVADTLRQSALAEDWRAWQAAWQTLDADVIAQALRQVESGCAFALTLCGERCAHHLKIVHARCGNASVVRGVGRPFRTC